MNDIFRDAPLSGIKVLDMTQILAGPFCTMLLGDMGADVIKVEKPDGGDDTRRVAPPFIGDESAAFLTINRNKRSIVIDLKTDEGADILRKLITSIDVLIQNMRPGAMERLGLGYEELSKINPALIYGTITGFGATGPYKDRAGFDLIAQGMSGLMSLTGFPGSPPLRAGVSLCDLNAGMYMTYAVLAAYIHRLRTGEGQLIDTSLLEAGIAYTIWESAIFFATGKSPKPMGSSLALSAPYQAIATRDGYITIGAANQNNWERLCKAIGREDLLIDARFANNPKRVENRADLQATLEDTFRKHTSRHWLDVLDAAGFPCGPINDIEQVYADPQVKDRGMLVELQHSGVGTIKNIGIPVKLTKTPGSIRRPPPKLGEHTDEVLSEFGFTKDQIAGLRERGVIR